MVQYNMDEVVNAFKIALKEHEFEKEREKIHKSDIKFAFWAGVVICFLIISTVAFLGWIFRW